MQAVKDKLSDISAMRKAKAEAKAEEQAEKEIAKARVDVAHEVRMAREAEAAMELHVAKAGQKAEREMAKHPINHDAMATGNNATEAPPTGMAGAPPTAAAGVPATYTAPLSKK